MSLYVLHSLIVIISSGIRFLCFFTEKQNSKRKIKKIIYQFNTISFHFHFLSDRLYDYFTCVYVATSYCKLILNLFDGLCIEFVQDCKLWFTKNCYKGRCAYVYTPQSAFKVLLDVLAKMLSKSYEFVCDIVYEEHTNIFKNILVCDVLSFGKPSHALF